MSHLIAKPAGLWLAFCLACSPLSAEEGQRPHVSVELNAVEQVDTSCRVSFLVRNGHATDLDQVVYETVLFDTEGRVDRLTLFDFGALPSNRPRVRQFVVPDLQCASLGRVLINGAETCTGENLPENACSGDLDLRSRTAVEVLG